MGVIRNILNSRFSKNGNFSFELQKILGFLPNDQEYYHEAFTHKSLQRKDEAGIDINYERLEFLGDAILGAVVSGFLFKELPDSDEGNLTKMRSKIVSRDFLNYIGKDLNLLHFMRKECQDDLLNQLGNNIHGDIFEALVGAVYVDRGYKYCHKFIKEKIIADYVDIRALDKKIISYKSYLIEWCQKEKKPIKFEDQENHPSGKPKQFEVKLKIGGNLVGKARSTSKKRAEEKAAKLAYSVLQENSGE